MTSDVISGLERRFGDGAGDSVCRDAVERLAAMILRGSCRSFAPDPVEPDLVTALCAAALSAPTKSDLQQRDIIVIDDVAIRRDLDRLLHTDPWVPGAPQLLIICGNNRRQRALHALRGHAFANDHLDAFFNAAVDAAIALSALVTAAEAVGLGCCPISAIRNHAADVGRLLRLPDHVFPVAGLALGYPADPAPTVSVRLPLAMTVHRNAYREGDLPQDIAAYDDRRADLQPYARQRHGDRFGEVGSYGWSEDKARQYSLPERTAFGQFVRDKGFKLD